MKNGITLIAEERQRQIEKEGFSLERDDLYTDDSLANAAACYAIHKPNFNYIFDLWPESWDLKWFKPSPENRIKELVKAGALISAEIDRRLRMEGQYSPQQLQTESIYWPCPNCNQDTNSKEHIICCSQSCLKQWLEKTNIGKVNEI